MRENGQGTYGSRYNKSSGLLTTDETGQNFLIITSSASPGSSGAYIDITPSSSMILGGIGNGLIGDPDGMEFWYYCENHVGAGNRVYIYDNGKAVTSTANYTERVTVGAQNSFTDTAGGGSNFSFAAATQTFDVFFNGITTTNQWGSVDTKTVTQYTAASTAVTLTAGPVSLVNIVYPSVHVKSSGGNTTINASSYTSYTPNYAPSYDGQVHGGNSMMFFLSAGYRSINQYLEVYNSTTNEIIGSKYLNQATAYGAKDGTHQWVADDSGGAGIYSVIGTTEITLEDGTTKLAKDITLNDRILSWDSDTDMWVSARLSDIKKRNVSEVYKLSVDGNDIEVSDSHGFWLFGNEQNSGQITAKELYKNKEAGSPMTQDSLKLWVKDGDSKTKVSITNIRKVEKDIEVITFSVPNYVNYVSNNIISHNVYGGGYGGLNWYQQTMGSATSATGLATGAGGTTSLDVDIPSAGDYKIRFKINLISKAKMSVTVGQTASSTVTTTYTAHSYRWDSNHSADDAYSNSGNTSSTLWRPTVAIQKNNNFVEIIPAGIQVVSGTGRYSRLSRRDQNSSDVELLEVIDGSVKIQSR
ncbi:MAG: Hint domain-containing protein, partial [Methylophagaceae bacterium]